MTLEELRNAVCRYIDENREAYNETGDECYRAVKEELLHILGLIDSVDHEPVGNSDKMTLTELARELRKIFRFKYLTAHRSGVELFLRMYAKKPSYFKTYNVWGNADAVFFPIAVSEDLRIDLDLSEYADEHGEIDYSKCIVEVG